MLSTYVYRAGRVRRLKEGVDINQYLIDYPEAIKVCKPPTETTLEKWNDRGGCKAIDGCWVEPDGTCPHGHPSWLMAMGWI